MKKYFLLVFLFIFCSNASAQYSGDVMLISNGGGLVNGTGYSGSITIGLPFGMLLQGGGYDSKNGLYGDTLRQTKVALDLKNESSIIFPNPTTGSFFVTIPKDFGTVRNIKLFDEQGSSLGNIDFISNGVKVQCTIPNKSNGTYFIRIEGKNSVTSRKVILVK